MEKTETIENLELIASRVPVGDRWRLTSDGPEGKIHPTLTDALEAYLSKKEEPKKYDLYGELNWKQGA